MRLLFDENLSRRLVASIQQLFPGSVHVTQVGLSSGTSDREVWDFALRNGFAIITADRDFLTLSQTLGHPPKIILLENCDYPTAAALQLLQAEAIRITQFESNDRPTLILRRR